MRTRTPVALPPYRKSEGKRVMERYHFEQSAAPLDQRLQEQAKRLRKEVGVERDKLIRLARQAETAAHIQDWLTSPGLQAPR
jgi:hypothetical protein